MFCFIIYIYVYVSVTHRRVLLTAQKSEGSTCIIYPLQQYYCKESELKAIGHTAIIFYIDRLQGGLNHGTKKMFGQCHIVQQDTPSRYPSTWSGWRAPTKHYIYYKTPNSMLSILQKVIVYIYIIYTKRLREKKRVRKPLSAFFFLPYTLDKRAG